MKRPSGLLWPLEADAAPPRPPAGRAAILSLVPYYFLSTSEGNSLTGARVRFTTTHQRQQ